MTTDESENNDYFLHKDCSCLGEIHIQPEIMGGFAINFQNGLIMRGRVLTGGKDAWKKGRDLWLRMMANLGIHP